MVRRYSDIEEARLVELEGERSEGEDFDADEGGVLVTPLRIVAVRLPEWQRIEAIASE
jgi:hypothetical protein